jgi:phosphotransferase system IIA component
MEINSDSVEIIEKMDEEVNSGDEITDLELKIKKEEIENVKTEVIPNNSEPHQIIGGKRKNKERSNLQNENKKIKDEFVVLEESDYKQEPTEIEELNLDDFNNQVITVVTFFRGNYIRVYFKKLP